MEVLALLVEKKVDFRKSLNSSEELTFAFFIIINIVQFACIYTTHYKNMDSFLLYHFFFLLN